MSARSLPALRLMVASFRSLAMKRGNAEEMGATWSFSYRPAEEQESVKEISEPEFKGEPETGHPRPGEYTATAKGSDGDVLFDFDGEWMGDVTLAGGGGDEKPDGIAGMIAALTKAGTATLNNAEQAEAKAHRRAAQAEARESKARTDLEEALTALDAIRREKHIAEVARQVAEADRVEAEAQRDAAIADKEEILRTGGELAAPINAFVLKAYQVACVHLGEDPIAVESDLQQRAVDESLNQVATFLLLERIALPMCVEYPANPDGTPRTAILALLLHHHYGLPWPPLRILFHTSFGVFMMDPPPIDWVPPGPDEKSEEAPAETSAVPVEGAEGQPA